MNADPNVEVCVRSSQAGIWISNDEVNPHDRDLLWLSWNLKSKSGIRLPVFVIHFPGTGMNIPSVNVYIGSKSRICNKPTVGYFRKRLPIVGSRIQILDPGKWIQSPKKYLKCKVLDDISYCEIHTRLVDPVP